MVHLYQVTLLNQGEGNSERIHPKSCWVHRITQRDVTCDTLIKPVFAEYAEGRCEAAFQVFPFFVLVFEAGRSRELGHVNLGLGFTQTRLERRFGGGAVVPIALNLCACCCGWCHLSSKSAVVQLIRILWISRSKVQKRTKQMID